MSEGSELILASKQTEGTGADSKERDYEGQQETPSFSILDEKSKEVVTYEKSTSSNNTKGSGVSA